MRAPAALALILAALVANTARAQPAPDPVDSGIVLGARVGRGAPFGEVERGGVAVGDLVEHKVPVGVELGYRFNRRLASALYLELAPASVQPAYCSPGTPCSASDFRGGITLQLRLAPGSPIDPWIGAGFGVEVLEVRAWEPVPVDADVEWSWAGFELPLEAGIDLRLHDRFALGPYLSVTAARFTSVSRRPAGGAETRGAIDGRIDHGWIQAGLRVLLRL